MKTLLHLGKKEIQ